jgi:addiction module HigA family antidote
MNPVHPGALVAPLLLEPTGLSQSEFSRRLGFNQPQPVNELIKGKRGFTAKMALLFEQATEGRYPAEFWLLLQMRWDLSLASEGLSNARRSRVDPIAPVLGARELKEIDAHADGILRMARTIRSWDKDE